MNCDFNDVFAFYSLLPRANYVFQLINKDKVNNIVSKNINDLLDLKLYYKDKFERPFMHRIDTVFFWNNMMRRLKFMVKQKNCPDIYIDQSLSIFENVQNELNYSVQLLRNMEEICNDTYEVLTRKLRELATNLDRTN